MLFSSFIALFATLAATSPLDSQPSARHPSLDTLDRFASLIGKLGDEIGSWDGNPDTVYRFVRRSREAIDTLHAATNQIANGDNLDYWTVLSGFGPAGLSINTKTHALANALASKNSKFKAIRQEQTIFDLLDQSYTESTLFFETTSKKMPPGVYTLMKPFHTELLGTLAVARESYRPSQQVVVVIVQNPIPGGPPVTYTLPPGSPMPTGGAQFPPYDQYQQPPQYGQGPQYPQYPPQYPQNPGQADYSPYTPKLARAP